MNNLGMQNKAYFGAGCFWGVEYYFSKALGVICAKSGYMGGKIINPSYEKICQGNTGHVETVEVTFDESQTNFENLCKLFFEIHNFEQIDGQGNDKGDQYLSVIFAVNNEQKSIAQNLIKILGDKNYKVATKIFDAKKENSEKFWPAEDYHQNYYEKTGGKPYCHFHKKIF